MRPEETYFIFLIDIKLKVARTTENMHVNVICHDDISFSLYTFATFYMTFPDHQMKDRDRDRYDVDVFE